MIKGVRLRAENYTKVFRIEPLKYAISFIFGLS